MGEYISRTSKGRAASYIMTVKTLNDSDIDSFRQEVIAINKALTCNYYRLVIVGRVRAGDEWYKYYYDRHMSSIPRAHATEYDVYMVFTQGRG